MSKEFQIKKYLKCGAIVKVMEDCNCPCGINCCGEEMKELIPNSVDAAIEKHVPSYEINGDKIIVKVNHVMEEDHYIEWICVVSDSDEIIKYYKPGDEPVLITEYKQGLVLYAYCNKHGLWKKEV